MSEQTQTDPRVEVALEALIPVLPQRYRREAAHAVVARLDAYDREHPNSVRLRGERTTPADVEANTVTGSAQKAHSAGWSKRCDSTVEAGRKRCGLDAGHDGGHTFFHEPSGETSWSDAQADQSADVPEPSVSEEMVERAGGLPRILREADERLRALRAEVDVPADRVPVSQEIVEVLAVPELKALLMLVETRSLREAPGTFRALLQSAAPKLRAALEQKEDQVIRAMRREPNDTGGSG